MVIAYDGVVAGQRALSQMRSVLSHLPGLNLQLQPELWRFDLLKNPDVFKLALNSARRADLLVLSVNNPQALSPQTVDWISRWITAKRGGTAAIALLGSTDSSIEGSNLIRNAAQNAGLDFIASSPTRENRTTPQLQMRSNLPTANP